MNQFPARFGAVYALIGAWAIASILGFFVILYAPVGTLAHKSDIKNALGASTTKELVAQAEQEIASEAAASYITITSQKLVKVQKPNKDTVNIYIAVKTLQIGDLKLKVTFHKGIYTIKNVVAV